MLWVFSLLYFTSVCPEHNHNQRGKKASTKPQEGLSSGDNCFHRWEFNIVMAECIFPYMFTMIK